MQIDTNDHINYATYREHPDPLLNGNPLTECLTVILSRNDVFEQLKKGHPTVENFSDLPKFYQKSQINHFNRVISPHPMSFFLYQKIMELILCGYIDRNPLQPANVRLLSALAEGARDGQYVQYINPTFGITSAPSCLVSGLSGSSKTTTLRTVLSLIEQLIPHKEYAGMPFMRKQLTYISFDCSASPSPKALALSFFAAVDKALNTEYFKEWEKRGRDSVERFYANMQLIAAKHHIGLIHIDEVQFFLKYSASKNSPNLIILESLFNKIGIPVFLSCTTEGLALFKPVPSYDSSELPDISIPRRMISEREFVFSTYQLNSDEFNAIYDAFFPEEICIGGRPSEEFKVEFHRLSAGLPAIINRLARLHHEQVITVENVKTDDIGLLNAVYNSQFRHIDFALSRIRNSNQTTQLSSKQVQDFEKNLPRESSGHANWSKKSPSKGKGIVEHNIPDMPEYGYHEKGTEPVSDDDFDVGI
ncbi:MAG: ATP-binding protein [Oceanospirillaceae bacterium]|nr:ATP-binding protein [Oceanospirillaceae bacterium]